MSGTPKVYQNGQWVPAGLATPGTPENIADGYSIINRRGVWVPERFAREQDLDDLRDVVEGHHHDEKYGGWRVIDARANRYGGDIGTPYFYLGSDAGPYYAGTSGASTAHIYLNPADWGPTGMNLRARAWCQTETDPTDSNLEFVLASLAAVGAGGTIGSGSLTDLAGLVTGVNATNSIYTGVSNDIKLTAAGWYHIAMRHTVAPGQAMTYGYTLLGKPSM